MNNIIKIISVLLVVAISFWAGMAWYQFQYEDWCLDMGGGKNTGNHKYCVIENLPEGWFEDEVLIDDQDMIPIESNNGIGDGAAPLDELLVN